MGRGSLLSRAPQTISLQSRGQEENGEMLSYSDRASGVLQDQILVLVAVRKVLKFGQVGYDIQVSVKDDMKIPRSTGGSVSSRFLQDIFSVNIGESSAQSLSYGRFLPKATWQERNYASMVFMSRIDNQAIGYFSVKPIVHSAPFTYVEEAPLVVLGIYNHKAWTDILDAHEIQSQLMKEDKIVEHQLLADFLDRADTIEKIKALYGPNGERRSILHRHLTSNFKRISESGTYLKVEIKRSKHLNRGIFEIEVSNCAERLENSQNIPDPDALTIPESMLFTMDQPVHRGQRTWLREMLLERESGFQLVHSYQ